MKRIILISCLFAIILLSSCATNRKDITLTKQGETKYHIVVPDRATDNEMYAAQLMQEYLYKISGAKIPIVRKCRHHHKEEIHIGKTSKDLGMITQDNTVGVLRRGQTLIFNCKDDNYTLYSVIDFLEKYLHVRRFTKDCDYYPVDSNITIRCNDYSVLPSVIYTYTTPNTFREVRGVFVRRDKDMCRWLKNTLVEDYFANGFFVHTAKDLLSDKDYFETHPEYFAQLASGERSRDQVCWSNENVFQIMKTNLQNNMSLQPDRRLWSVSQNDNDTYCRCEKCKQVIDEYGSPAAPIILFVNRMAKAFPDKIISTLAYQYSRKCPQRLNVEKNVQIMLCTIEADRNRTIEELGRGEGSFAYDLVQWGKVTDNIFLWDYDVDFAYYLCPFPNLHVLQPNIQLFVKNNAFEQYQQANSDTGHEFAELKTYLISQLLWNPNADVKSIISEFCDNYYSDASKQVKQYIREIENEAIRYKNEVVLDIYGSPVRYKDNILSAENLNRWLNLFEEAKQSVREDSVALLRVKVAQLPLMYAKMEIAKTQMYGANGWFEKRNGSWQVKKDMAEMLEEFNRTCLQADVTDINESGLAPYEYYTATKRITENDVNGNIAFQKKVTADILPSKQYSSGDLAVLTDGVKGSDDYKMLWLGWWGEDVTIDVDLDTVVSDKQISISTLNLPKSWILHPISIECSVSCDNKTFTTLGEQFADGFNRNNPVIKDYNFFASRKFRYVRFFVKGTKTLPSWHPSYTKPSWFFVDEISVK